MVIFRETITIFPVRNTPNNKFLDVTNKETNKTHVPKWMKSIYYELGAINLYFEGATVSVKNTS